MRARSLASFLVLGAALTSCRAVEGLSDFVFENGGGSGATTSSTSGSVSSTGDAGGTTSAGGMGGMGGTGGGSRGGAGGVGGVGGMGGMGGMGGVGGMGGMGGAAGSGGAGGTGGVDAGPPEDCTNGVDDDGDGFVDCADLDCDATGFTCIAPAPDGWAGPFVLYEGSQGATPACPASYPTVAFEGGLGPIGPDAVCNACTCDTQAGGCDPDDLALFNALACGSSAGKISNVPEATCTAVPATTKSVKANNSAALLPCVPGGGGVAQLPPIAWTSFARGCGGATFGGGCGGAALCAPAAPATFGVGLCIAQTGDQSCPAEYPILHQAAEANDSRSCTGCTCGSKASSCAVHVEVFSDASCQTSMGSVDNANICLDGDGMVAAKVTRRTVCPPSGGAPTGTVTEDPWTVCCTF